MSPEMKEEAAEEGACITSCTKVSLTFSKRPRRRKTHSSSNCHGRQSQNPSINEGPPRVIVHIELGDRFLDPIACFRVEGGVAEGVRERVSEERTARRSSESRTYSPLTSAVGSQEGPPYTANPDISVRTIGRDTKKSPKSARRRRERGDRRRRAFFFFYEQM